MELEKEKLQLKNEAGTLTKTQLRARIIKLTDDVTSLRRESEKQNEEAQDLSNPQLERANRESTDSAFSEMSFASSTTPFTRHIESSERSISGTPALEASSSEERSHVRRSSTAKYAPLITMPHALNYAVTIRDKRAEGSSSRQGSISMESAPSLSSFEPVNPVPINSLGSKDRHSSILAVKSTNSPQ